MELAEHLSANTTSARAEKTEWQSAYKSGFGNEFASEAIPGALPVGRNSPQRVPHGLYAEQFSGTAFTAPRGSNRRYLHYRYWHATVHRPYRRIDKYNLMI